jgi:hypothetical protein
VVDAARDKMIRELRTLARRAIGKEPVVSITVAFGLVDGVGDVLRFERSIDDRRWNEI